MAREHLHTGRKSSLLLYAQHTQTTRRRGVSAVDLHRCVAGLRGEPEILPYLSCASDGGWTRSRKQLCTVIVVFRGLLIPEEPTRAPLFSR